VLIDAVGPNQKKAMRVRVSGKQIKIGETLPAGVKARLEEVVAKHFDGGAEAKVVFSHDGPFYRADCVLHLDSKTVLSAEGEGPDAHRAFDAAYIRLETQLRTYKRKLKNHHAKARARARAEA
jgi:ribosomal subunit interface protein